MFRMSPIRRLLAAFSRQPALTDEAIIAALKLDYEGFAFRWLPSWGHEDFGRLIVSRRQISIQFAIDRPRSVDQLLNIVREGVLDWIWQDFTETAQLKRESRI